MTAPATVARSALAGFADLILPARCVSCGSRVDDHGGVCASCWSALTFIEKPLCIDCGIPFEVAVEGEVRCAGCMAAKPAFAPLRAAIVYDEGSRPIILRFKHSDATHCAPLLAQWMARAGAEILADADYLIPVPLHRWRLFRRRYNQSALLATAVSKLTGVPTAPMALRRVRLTQSQGRLNKAERARNVQGAFALGAGWAEQLAGKNVVLVDDVSTTGATLTACAKALTKAGIATISSLTVAQTIAP